MRIEYKYLLDKKSFEILKQTLPLYFGLDKHCMSEGYLVSSLYYDSHDLKSFYEKDDGDSKKTKWRLRGYNNLSPTIHLEEKIKIGIHSYKRFYSSDHILTLPLFPKLKVEYHRLAFGNDDLRLTLDYNISFSKEPLIFSNSGSYVETMVFEVKAASKVSHTVLLKLISELRLGVTSFSKYGHGMRLLYDL